MLKQLNLYNTIEKLCSIHAPSGFESLIVDYLFEWFSIHIPHATVDRTIHNTLIICKGKPNIAFVAHADSVGFILQYQKKLIALGSPEINEKTKLRTCDNIFVQVVPDKDDNCFLTDDYGLETGTTFTFIPNFKLNKSTIQSPNLDDRVGIALLMQLAMESDDICIVISSNEESCGGSIEKASKILYEHYQITKTIIVDTTFHTEGIRMGNGVVLSLKDKYIPPQQWVSFVKNVLIKYNIPFQLEVEDFGASDGAYIHRSPYPIEWCFLGIACLNNHSENEMISISDMNYLYEAISSINKTNMYNI